MFWNRIPPSRNPFSVLISSVISAKENVNPPSIKISSFAPRHRNTSKDHCVFVSCWAFLCRFGNRFLAEPTSSCTGMRPAFLFLPASFQLFFQKMMRNPSGMTKNVVPPVLYSNMFSDINTLTPRSVSPEYPKERTQPCTKEKTRIKMPF